MCFTLFITWNSFSLYVWRKLPRECIHEWTGVENAWENNRPKVHQATVVEYRFDRLGIPLTGGLDVREERFFLFLFRSSLSFFFLVNARYDSETTKKSVFHLSWWMLSTLIRASSAVEKSTNSYVYIRSGKIRALANRTISWFFSAFVEFPPGILSVSRVIIERSITDDYGSIVDRRDRDDLIAKFLRW